MWNHIRELGARSYPAVLLLAIAHSFGAISDSASALAFSTVRNERHLDDIHGGRRALTLSAYETVVDQQQGATREATSSSRRLLWILVAGTFAYLLLARETWKFRLSMFGIILVATIAQAFCYPLY